MFPAIAIGLVFVIAGAWVLVHSIFELIMSFKSRNWPQTPGQIKSSEVERRDSGDGYTFRARISYAYKVGRVRYTSKRVFCGDGVSTFEFSAKELSQKYRPGDSVPVYYNPAAPWEAVLEPGIKVHPFIGVFVGFAMMAIGVWAASIAWWT